MAHRWFVSYDRGKRVGSVPFSASDSDHQFIVQLAEDSRVSPTGACTVPCCRVHCYYPNCASLTLRTAVCTCTLQAPHKAYAAATASRPSAAGRDVPYTPGRSVAGRSRVQQVRCGARCSAGRGACMLACLRVCSH
jgi:hypothetical protein